MLIEYLFSFLFQTMFWISTHSTTKLEYTLLRKTHSYSSRFNKKGNFWCRLWSKSCGQKVSVCIKLVEIYKVRLGVSQIQWCFWKMPYYSETYTRLNINTYISYNIQFVHLNWHSPLMVDIGSKSDNLVFRDSHWNCDSIFIISTFQIILGLCRAL